MSFQSPDAGIATHVREVSGNAPDSPLFSVILPMYNEARTVTATLRSLVELFDRRLGEPAEILVIDDGSSDGSADRVAEVLHASIRLIRHPYNIGNGAAVKTGIRSARGRWIVILDADGQHRVEDLPALLDQAERYDMVVGARTRQSQTDWHRDVANRVFNALGTYVCRRKIDDLTSGFRVVKAAIAKRFVYLLPNTFSYPTTLTLALLRAGYSVAFVPVQTQRRIGPSKLRPTRDGMRFLLIILKIAVFYAPLRVFIPVAGALFATGLAWYGYRVFIEQRPFPPVSSLLMVASVIVFMMGLVSEQIASLRQDRD